MIDTRIWTDDQLEQVLADGCRTWMEATAALGLAPNAVNRLRVRHRADLLGLELKRPAPSGADRREGGR